jgi:hypothetical protein
VPEAVLELLEIENSEADLLGSEFRAHYLELAGWAEAGRLP